MNTVLLDTSQHNRKGFDCGIDALNNYLKVMAGQHARKDNTRTFVLEATADNATIIGFYTLTMTPIDLKALPGKLQKKYHPSTAGGLIARLAVDKCYQGQGFGEWLLIDALHKLLTASDTVAFPVVIVDVKDGAQRFYEKYGFTAFRDANNKLFIPVADIRASLG
jgi:GNAT superfamily N-acetyltransferase